MKNYFKYLAFILIAFLFVQELDAQRRSSRRTSTSPRSTESANSFADPWYSISLGNIQFGSGFSISGKYSYGFEFKDRFSIGLSGKAFYDFLNQFNAPDINLFSYGIGTFARIKVVEEFFIIGDFGYNHLENAYTNGTKFSENLIYPNVGAGYKSGNSDWSYGIHVLFPLNDTARDFLNIEYWIDFNYKF